MKILVTGGAGFIGSAVVRHIINNTQDSVVNVDKLTYAGNTESLADVSDSERYIFEHADICDAAAVARIFAQHQPDVVMHWLLKAMLTVQLQALRHLLKPILLVLMSFWKRLAITGLLLMATRKIASVFIIFLLTKSMVICLILTK